MCVCVCCGDVNQLSLISTKHSAAVDVLNQTLLIITIIILLNKDIELERSGTTEPWTGEDTGCKQDMYTEQALKASSKHKQRE